MEVLVKNYTNTAEIWLNLPTIPQKGECFLFSYLRGMDGLSPKEKKLAEESTAFLEKDEENVSGNPMYVVTSRTFHNHGVVVLHIRPEDC